MANMKTIPSLFKLWEQKVDQFKMNTKQTALICMFMSYMTIIHPATIKTLEVKKSSQYFIASSIEDDLVKANALITNAIYSITCFKCFIYKSFGQFTLDTYCTTLTGSIKLFYNYFTHKSCP